MRFFYMESDRLGFSRWTEEDLPLAEALWGCDDVARYISAAGHFTPEEIAARWTLERQNQAEYGYSYWPLFLRDGGAFIGCCGLRPHDAEKGILEAGVHLLPAYWRQGYGSEAMQRALRAAFEDFGAADVFTGHNPKNVASRQLMAKLGFTCIGEEYYAPTGLMHPSYLYKGNGR